MNECWRLALEILTPVQVGSGEELHDGIDYVRQGAGVQVVDREACYRAIETSDTDLSEVAQGISLDDLVRIANLKPIDQGSSYVLRPLEGRMNAPGRIDKIREHYKDAFFHPTIPGSSLKGAIRTAIFVDLFDRLDSRALARLLPEKSRRSGRPTKKNTLAALDLGQHLFSPSAPGGKAPNHDLLRTLHIGDTVFSPGTLGLADIRWSNLRNGSAGWRDMATRRTERDWRSAQGIYAEVLAPGSVTVVNLQVDKFLLQDPLAGRALGRAFVDDGERLLGSFDALRRVINEHSRKHLERETEWFIQHGIHGAETQCRGLLRKMELEDHALYLRLGWGSGWRGMTGDWLDEKTLDDMRQLYRMGRTGAPFPKTRRLAVSGEPALPLGWVRLWDPKTSAQRLAEVASAQLTCDWVDVQIEGIAIADHVPEFQKNGVLFGKKLANAWKQIEDAELKAEALSDIRNRWREADRWDSPAGKAAKYAKSIYAEHE